MIFLNEMFIHVFDWYDHLVPPEAIFRRQSKRKAYLEPFERSLQVGHETSAVFKNVSTHALCIKFISGASNYEKDRSNILKSSLYQNFIG